MNEELLTILEVAQILRVDRTTVGRYLKRGALEYVSLTRSKRSPKRIKRAELEKFLEGNQNEQKTI